MVGHETLDLVVMVRIHLLQPISAKPKLILKRRHNATKGSIVAAEGPQP